MRKIAVINQKGGVGKTTTVVNTAAAMAAAGKRVIVMDMDPQAHLTIHLGVEPSSVQNGTYELLTAGATLEQSMTAVRENLWLVAANINLVGAESELVSVVGREAVLREAIKGVDGEYDFMFIDCPPSLGLLTLNALVAMEEIFIPVQPHFLALQGFGKLLETVALVHDRINPRLRVSGILLCMFESRASLPNEVKADIERFLEEARGQNLPWSDARMMPVCIRRNIKLAEAPSYGKTVHEYDPTCNGSADYLRIAEALLGRSVTVQPGQESKPIEGSEAVEDESWPEGEISGKTSFASGGDAAGASADEEEGDAAESAAKPDSDVNFDGPTERSGSE